jgi:hypothetical protein
MWKYVLAWVPMVVIAIINGAIREGWDTVGEPPSVEICLSNMPSLKAKKRGKRAPEKVLLEP